MSLIYYEGCENRIVSPIIRNCSAEELSIKEKIQQIIHQVALKNQRRNSSVNTEEYMQLPLADDELVLVPVQEQESESEQSQFRFRMLVEPVQEPEPDSDSDSESDESGSTDALSDEEKCHEIIGKPVLELSDDAAQSLGDCAICLGNVSQLVNATTTRCGHTFHTSCLLKAITCGAGNCPNCRALLVIKNDEDESEYESEYESDDESDDEENPQRYVLTLEQAAEKIQAMGYTFADILRSNMAMERALPDYNEERYTDEFIEKMWDDIYGVLYGNIPLTEEQALEAEPLITKEEAEELLEVLADDTEGQAQAEDAESQAKSFPRISQEYLDENYPWMKAQGARKNE